MTKWTKTVHKLAPGHGWKAKPGYKIFVADRGAVRFDHPGDWICVPGDDSIKFYDRQPPEDNCTLQVSYIRLPPIDWSGLALDRLLQQVVEDDERDVVRKGDLIQEKRPDLELTWTELTFLDVHQSKEARSRICLARGSNIQSLITMEFWPEDAERFGPVWDEALRSLQLGVYIEDPTHRSIH